MKLLREPLVHFLAAGTLVFASHQIVSEKLFAARLKKYDVVVDEDIKSLVGPLKMGRMAGRCAEIYDFGVYRESGAPIAKAELVLRTSRR